MASRSSLLLCSSVLFTASACSFTDLDGLTSGSGDADAGVVSSGSDPASNPESSSSDAPSTSVPVSSAVASSDGVENDDVASEPDADWSSEGDDSNYDDSSDDDDAHEGDDSDHGDSDHGDDYSDDYGDDDTRGAEPEASPIDEGDPPTPEDPHGGSGNAHGGSTSAGGASGEGGTSMGGDSGEGGSGETPDATGCALLSVPLAEDGDRTLYMIELPHEVDLSAATLTYRIHVEVGMGGRIIAFAQHGGDPDYDLIQGGQRFFNQLSGWTEVTWDIAGVEGNFDKTVIKRVGLEISTSGASEWSNPTVVAVDSITLSHDLAGPFLFDDAWSVSDVPGDEGVLYLADEEWEFVPGSSIEWVDSR